MNEIATSKIVGVFSTYSDEELRAETIEAFAHNYPDRLARIFAEIAARKSPPAFADESTVNRAFANVRDAVKGFDLYGGAGYGVVTVLTGDYATRSVSGRIAIGFRFLANDDGVRHSGYVYLAGPDALLYFVKSADEIGNDLEANDYASADDLERKILSGE